MRKWIGRYLKHGRSPQGTPVPALAPPTAPYSFKSRNLDEIAATLASGPMSFAMTDKDRLQDESWSNEEALWANAIAVLCQQFPLPQRSLPAYIHSRIPERFEPGKIDIHRLPNELKLLYAWRYRLGPRLASTVDPSRIAYIESDSRWPFV